MKFSRLKRHNLFDHFVNSVKKTFSSEKFGTQRRLSCRETIPQKELLEEVDVGIAVADAKGELTFCNKKAAEFHGSHRRPPLPKEEWAKIFTLYDAEGVTPLKPEETPMLKVLNEGEIRDYEVVIVPTNGPRRSLNVNGHRTYDNKGNVTGAICAVHDISSLRKAELERKKFEKALTKSHTEKKVREEFISSISHDLQTPLHLVSGFASILNSEENLNTAEKDLWLTKIQENANRASQMIQDLLDSNAFRKNGQVNISPERLKLISFLKDVVKPFKIVDNLQINLEAKHEEMSCVWDSRGIQRVIENLINNAYKYGLENTPVFVGSEYDSLNDSVCLSVFNYGTPIPAKRQREIFQFQEQGDSPTKNNAHRPGWGIGLFLVQAMVRSHGGKIELKSDHDMGGTRFSVHLPREARQSPPETVQIS